MCISKDQFHQTVQYFIIMLKNLINTTIFQIFELETTLKVYELVPFNYNKFIAFTKNLVFEDFFCLRNFWG